MSPGAETIAALATPRGASALAVLRVSGPEALAVAARCFRPEGLADAPSHTAHVGWIVDGAGERVDQVVATVFRAPRSATGEDVVEVSCHGGDAAPQAVLRALLAAGARPAAPGEFTQRAFLNGKLDLAQAEAIADLIHARSERARRTATRHLAGHYSDALRDIRAALVQTAALVELELDFSEEDVTFADRAALEALLADADAHLGRLLATSRMGTLVRDGVRVVLGGRPNAGKSTLLNALLERDRAIVSDTPGTTRDAVEDERSLAGLLFRFTDTAGLRETADAIEAEGVRRAREAAREADVLLYVYDARQGLDDEERTFLEDLARSRPALPILRVANKADLLLSGTAVPDEGLALSALAARAEPDLLRPLRDALVAAAEQHAPDADASLLVVNERHRTHLAAARKAVARARRNLTLGGDLLALDLREALAELGAVTGEVTRDDVLGAIFSQFCIGK